MPLDFTHQLIADIPENLDFEHQYEDTKFDGKKYVINGSTGDYLGIVGDGFTCASHGKFFTKVQEVMMENLSQSELLDADVRWSSCRNNAWAKMDINLPNVAADITTSKHSSKVARRFIALHGVDGSCSNLVFFGAIDFFCTNGIIVGKHDKVKRKNTSGFNLTSFADKLHDHKDDFEADTKKFQRWAETDISSFDVKNILESIIKSDNTAEKMFSLYNQEAATRGRNLWALYSAFTNYATYADDRNGFHLRNTGNDNDAENMYKREHEVAGWIDSPAFKRMELAAA